MTCVSLINCFQATTFNWNKKRKDSLARNEIWRQIQRIFIFFFFEKFFPLFNFKMQLNVASTAFLKLICAINWKKKKKKITCDNNNNSNSNSNHQQIKYDQRNSWLNWKIFRQFIYNVRKQKREQKKENNSCHHRHHILFSLTNRE